MIMADLKKNFDSFLTTSLNDQQLKAVQQKNGSILVIAGAGSGKTRVITARIANLIINENVQPHAIVALTFTNKAAKEMQERITKFLDSKKNLPFIGTFHSYCLQLLKKNQHLLDTPFFSILDDDDQLKLLTGIINRFGLKKEVSAKELSYQISRLKTHVVDAQTMDDLYKNNPLTHQLFNAYEQERKASKCLDFDDLLLEGFKLFANNKEFKKEMQDLVRHILVDEYQDTNILQHELLKQMAKNRKGCAVDSICVVGDEDQSIYSWRGATIANILNFKHDFSNTSIIKIEQNYRSVQPILDIANHVIQHNRERTPKKLWSERKGKDRIRTLACLSEYQEGDVIAQFVKTVQNVQKTNEIAILYRTHFQSRTIEEALIKNSIVYKIIGGTQFYERKEIKDLLAYLRLIVNPFDRASFFRVINAPTRGLGDKFEELFYARWHHEPFLTFHEVAFKLIAENEVAKTKKTALEQFLRVFEAIQSTDTPSKALETIIQRTGYLGYVKDSYDTEEATTRIENIQELLSALQHFETNNISTITQFLDEVALMQEKLSEKEEHKKAILLMTLHAAKGLEFDTVILAGLEDGLLPSSRSSIDLEKLEEERRLFYVGITRAKERLLLTRARFRYAFRNMTDQQPSRFLDEIPEELVSVEDCSYWKSPQMHDYFNTWLRVKVSFKQPTVYTFGPARKTDAIKTTNKPATSSVNKSLGGWKKNHPVSGYQNSILIGLKSK